jgi:fructose-bisphosphate aldolase class I
MEALKHPPRLLPARCTGCAWAYNNLHLAVAIISPVGYFPEHSQQRRVTMGNSIKEDQSQKIREGNGSITAFDESGGSSPKTLLAYGIDSAGYNSELEMLDLTHAFRTRVIVSPAYTEGKVVGAIIFEDTMNRTIDGKPTARYLWEDAHVVPFLKVDEGLAPEADGVQLMKPILGLDKRLADTNANGIFGTKTRSVINEASLTGIKSIVKQQFEIAARIIDAGLMPIIEPEVNIKAADKALIEDILLSELFAALAKLPVGQKVMLKLTPPEKAGLYDGLVNHPNVLKVVALSGGYPRDEACRRVKENKGIIASFSRGMREDLKVTQTDEEFDNTLRRNLNQIYEASIT